MTCLALFTIAACARSATAPADAQLLVRTATMRVLVERLGGVEAALRARVEALGGFTTTSAFAGHPGASALTVGFRVPSARLEEALAEIASMATEVEAREVRGEDFTEEFVDARAQLSNLRATRERLRALLEKATTVDEALHVNTALGEVQADLERLEGRTTWLDKAAAMSSVTVAFVPTSESEWRPLAVARDAGRALVRVGQFLVDAAIVGLVFAPLWAPLAWVLRRKRRAATGS